MADGKKINEIAQDYYSSQISSDDVIVLDEAPEQVGEQGYWVQAKLWVPSYVVKAHEED